ncbi:hypothetical protein CHARACLAT_028609 [Characodon lateralis]|uniref:F-box domain-containing protein n=1 Tax=Characodon lateralis TaxID=208331 RepID=A0ABU7DKL2_9TELE|nr:hypothetical protein [Characodon lateralis]
MAAVVERVDGCVGSLDTDAVSLRHSTSPQEQPHQNNPLLGLPIVAIETILNFLSYDEISMLRSVSRTQRGSWMAAELTLAWAGWPVLLVGCDPSAAGLCVVLEGQAGAWFPAHSLVSCHAFPSDGG